MVSLAQVITDAVESRLTSLHTLLPGRVVKVDLARGRCDVEPLLMRQGSSGEAIAMPIITDCPIAFYRAGKAAVYLPLKPGDQVEIRFCERSIDTWLSKGGVVDPADSRKHHLSDAVVYPGLYDGTQPPEGIDASSLIIVHDQAKVSLKADGEVLIENSGGSIRFSADGKYLVTGSGGELLAHLITHLTNLIAAQVIDPLTGPQPFFPADKQKFTTDKTNIQGMKA